MVSGLLARCPFFFYSPPRLSGYRTSAAHLLEGSAASTRFALRIVRAGCAMAVAVAAGGLLVTSSRAVHPWQGFGNS
jgi:hypothetical protein